MDSGGSNKQDIGPGKITQGLDVTYQGTRRSPRIPYYKKLKYGLLDNKTEFNKVNKIRFNGFTLNISEQGIGIEGNRAFPPNFKIQIRLFTGEKALKLEGIVRWAHQTSVGKWHMGIELTSRKDYLKEIHKHISQISD